ncbi:hypothetical protein AKJ09_06144 [Labilithrix luteola]|uniref:Type IV fimbrial biogenesis protein PilY1 n=1 Tax=Labilithrix luteola TaxID=1391654 RepID=A0A0K1Q117_9BACT|nr:hypothetical protein [Labilithrix luteola]AKU99480.1 hypothetical protein AKJ09_06144 [Labilithrix luteola]
MMARRLRFGILSGLSLLVLRAVSGCASDATSNDGTPTPNVDAGNTLADATSDTPDAAPEADPRDAALPPCSVEGWCYVDLPGSSSLAGADGPRDPNGFTFPLRAIWIAPDHRAFAVSARGHVLAWDGKAWQVIFLSKSGLRAVWGTSSGDVWVGGDAGALFHGTMNGGALTFRSVASGTAHPITKVWGTSSHDVWLIADTPYHLDPSTANTASPFVGVTVPSSYGEGAGPSTITAVWGTASDTWLGGMATTFCAPPNCTNAKTLFVARRTLDGSAGATWDTAAIPVDQATAIVSGLSTSDGVQHIVANANFITDRAVAIRLAEDATKLDSAHGAIRTSGAYSWNYEDAEKFGAPRGFWERIRTISGSSDCPGSFADSTAQRGRSRAYLARRSRRWSTISTEFMPSSPGPIATCGSSVTTSRCIGR